MARRVTVWPLAALLLLSGTPLMASAAPEPSSQSRAASVPDDTVSKAGAALRDISSVQQNYEGRIASAPDESGKRALSDQATSEAMQAIQTHGLTVQDYLHVVRLAQADPGLKKRLLDAAEKAQ